MVLVNGHLVSKVDDHNPLPFDLTFIVYGFDHLPLGHWMSKVVKGIILFLFTLLMLKVIGLTFSYLHFVLNVDGFDLFLLI